MTITGGDDDLPTRGKMDERADQTADRDSGGSRAAGQDDNDGDHGDGDHDQGNDRERDRDPVDDPGNETDGGEAAEMSALLSALGKLAQEDEQAMWATLPPGAIPVLSGDDKDRIARRIVAMQVAERAQAGNLGSDRASRATDQLGQRRQLRLPGWAMAIGGATAAAAALLLVMNGSPSRGDRSAVPDYSVSATGGLKTLRGGPGHAAEPESAVAERQILGPDNELRVICRPQTSVRGAVAARAFFVHDGQWRELRPEMRTADSGAIELTARARDIVGVASGAGGAGRDAELRIVVGRPEVVAALRPQPAWQGTSGPEAHWLTVPIELPPARVPPVNSR